MIWGITQKSLDEWNSRLHKQNLPTQVIKSAQADFVCVGAILIVVRS